MKINVASVALGLWIAAFELAAELEDPTGRSAPHL